MMDNDSVWDWGWLSVSEGTLIDLGLAALPDSVVAEPLLINVVVGVDKPDQEHPRESRVAVGYVVGRKPPNRVLTADERQRVAAYLRHAATVFEDGVLYIDYADQDVSNATT